MRWLSTVLVALLATSTSAQAQKLIWELSTGVHPPLCMLPDTRSKPFLYAALQRDGLVVYELSETNRAPRRVANLPMRKLGLLTASYLEQQGDLLYVALGNFFNALGSKSGLAIVDIKNPRMPKVLSVWTSPQREAGSHIVTVQGKYAYLGVMEKGIRILDISNPKQIKSLSITHPDIHFPNRNPN